MTKLKFALLSLSMLTAAPAFAEGDMHMGPMQGHMDGMDPAAFHKEMCTDHYAHAYGRLAYMKAKVGITDQQQAAWDKWAKAETDAATKERDACLQEPTPSPDKPMTMLDQEEHMEHWMSAKLDDMRAARPALEALYTSLTPEQKTAFDEAGSWHHEHGGEPHDMHGPGNKPGAMSDHKHSAKP